VHVIVQGSSMKEEAKARLLKLMQETAHNQARLLT
jgi:hypothetical protein